MRIPLSRIILQRDESFISLDNLSIYDLWTIKFERNSYFDPLKQMRCFIFL